jgi:hypothetical protein
VNRDDEGTTDPERSREVRDVEEVWSLGPRGARDTKQFPGGAAEATVAAKTMKECVLGS